MIVYLTSIKNFSEHFFHRLYYKRGEIIIQIWFWNVFFFLCSSPSVLFMDEVDSLCPAGNQKSVSGNDVLAAVIRGIHIVQVRASGIWC